MKVEETHIETHIGTKDLVGAVQLKLTTTREFRLRTKVATWLVKVAAYVSGGVLKVEVVKPRLPRASKEPKPRKAPRVSRATKAV